MNCTGNCLALLYGARRGGGRNHLLPNLKLSVRSSAPRLATAFAPLALRRDRQLNSSAWFPATVFNFSRLPGSLFAVPLIGGSTMRKQDRIANQKQSQRQESDQKQSPSQPQPKEREQMRGSASETERQPRRSGKLPLPD